jgi:hypothetical protein
MLKSTKSLLLAALAATFATSADAQTTPQKGEGTQMPESYRSFFPAAALRGVKSQMPSTSLFNERISDNAPMARPRLNPPASAIKRAPADQSDIYGYLYYTKADQNLGMYRINPSEGATYMWTDEATVRP